MKNKTLINIISSRNIEYVEPSTSNKGLPSKNVLKNEQNK